VKIATWNVNSVRARLPVVLDWLDQAAPDVLLLQETKTVCAQFPTLPFAERGYQLATFGEPALNGVAIVAKHPIEDRRDGLPGDTEDREARYIEATVGDVRVASVYVPNGTTIGSDRFAYKLAFFDRLRDHAQDLLEQDATLVIGGDYNVAPTPEDVYDAAALEGTICYHPDERAKYRTLLNLGLYDGFRTTQPRTHAYSWWHYQGRSFELDHGMRIDHLLLSPYAVDRLDTCAIDDQVRAVKQPSDHVPVWCTLID